MKTPGLLKAIYATAAGYFVKDCPRCGQIMYGQDWRGGGVPCAARPWLTHGVCPACLNAIGYDPHYQIIRPPLPATETCAYCTYLVSVGGSETNAN